MAQKALCNGSSKTTCVCSEHTAVRLLTSILLDLFEIEMADNLNEDWLRGFFKEFFALAKLPVL